MKKINTASPVLHCKAEKIMKTVYLKIFDTNFYKITDGHCVSINTQKKSFKENKYLPSGEMKYVTISSEEEFNAAKKSIGI